MRSTVGSAAMVGRRAELTAVRSLVEGVPGGRGGVLLVTGEAGIGKSRLLGEAVGCARDVGLDVLTGRAVEGGGTYRAVAEALVGRLGGELPATSAEIRPYRAALGRVLPGWAEPGEVAGSGVDPALVLGEGLLRLLRALGGGRGCLLVLRAVGVTSREMDVLGLVAEGLTNREIAERLFLSRRTVDTHVASLLAKTNTADRAQLRTSLSR